MKKLFRTKSCFVLLAVLILVVMLCSLSACGKCKHSSYTDTVVPPTCTADGYTVHKCTECDHEYTDTTVEKLGHAYTETVTKQPTCSAEGEKTLDCSRCDDTQTQAIAKDPTAHNHSNVTVVNPTCIAEGYTVRKCECGDTVTDTKTMPTGHTYASVVTAPTCRSTGYTTHTCACGHSYVDSSVPMLPHSYVSTVTAPTCIAQGYTLHTCGGCGDSYKDTFTAMTQHSWDAGSNIQTVSCTRQGITEYHCLTEGCEETKRAYTEPTGHNYDEVGVVTPPSCIAQGYTLHTCDACGDSYKDSFTAMTDHDWDTGSNIQTVSCTQQGITEYSCQTDGCEETKRVYTNPTGHSYNPVGVVTPPTCTTGGYTTHTCTNGTCTASYKTDETAPTDHSWSTEGRVIVPVTCTTDGVMEFSCTNGDCQAKTTEDIVHTGHDTAGHVAEETDRQAVGVPLLGTQYSCCIFDITYKTECNNDGCEGAFETKREELHEFIWEITTTAKCNTPGEKTYICSKCHAHHKTEQPKPYEDPNNHAWNDGVTANGVTTYTCANCNDTKTVINSTTGEVSTEALKEAGSVKVENAESNASAEIKFPEALTNSFESDNVKVSVDSLTPDEAGITDPDLKEKIGDAPIYNFLLKDGENEVHSFGEDASGAKNKVTVTLPYTLKEGEDPDNIIVYYIDENGEIQEYEAIYSNGFAIFETDHFSHYVVLRLSPAEMCEKFTHINVTVRYNATCIRDGYSITKCTRCGLVTREDGEKATGHNHAVKEVVPATCAAGGYTVYDCTKCDHTYKGDYTAALTHEWDDGTPVGATCIAKGYTLYSCEHGCGTTYKDNYTDFADHVWDNGVFSKTPTCTTNGTKLYTCENCNDTKSEHVDATGHDYEATVVPATCSTKGYTAHVCSTCGDSYNDTYTDFADHVWDNGVFSKTPTCTTNGTKLYTCTICRDTRSEHVDATGHSYSAVVTPPTCEAKGYTTHTCSACGDSYKDAYTDMVAHTWVNGVCSVCSKACSHAWGAYTYNNDETCTKNGTESATCIECGTKDTREKVGTATGHDYENGVCKSCGDGCTHSWGDYTYNNDATCTENGTKSRTCNNCGTKETVTAEGTAKNHAFGTDGTCSACGTTCSHSYENGYCTVCGKAESASGFFANFVESIFDSNSIYFELNNFKFTDTYKFASNNANTMGIGVDNQDITMKAALEFDSNGDPILKVYGGGVVTQNGTPVPVTAELYYKDGVMYMASSYTYGDKVETEYSVEPVDLSILSYLFGKKDMPAGDENGMYSASFMMLGMISNFEFDMISDPVEGLLNLVLLKEQTQNGYNISFNIDKLKALNNILRDETIEELVNRILGEDSYNKVINYIVNSFDKNMYEVMIDVRTYLDENGKITAEKFNEVFESMNGMTMEELRKEMDDVILGDLFDELFKDKDKEEIKKMLKYGANRIADFTPYEFIGVALESNDMEMDIWATVDSYLNEYSDIFSFVISTDADGRLVSINAKVDAPEDAFFNNMTLDASIIRNKTFDYNPTALLANFEESEISLDGISEGLSKTYEVIHNADGSITIRYYPDSYGSEDSFKNQDVFLTNYNGVPCKVVYTSEVKYYYSYTVQAAFVNNDACLGEALKNAKHIVAYCTGDGTYEEYTDYARYYSVATDELVHTEVLSHRIDNYGSNPNTSFVFSYDKTTNKLINIDRESYIPTHNYAPLDEEAYKTLACGSAYKLSSTCASCGAVTADEHYDIKLHSLVVTPSHKEGSHSCADGILYNVSCANCKQAVDIDVSGYYDPDHAYKNYGYSFYKAEICVLCGYGSVEIDEDYKYYTQDYDYVDDDEIEHSVTVYIPMHEMHFLAVDSYVTVDGDGNEVYHVDYYTNVQFNNDEYDYALHIKTTPEYAHEHDFVGTDAEPEVEEKDNADGTKTLTATMVAVCSCGKTETTVYVSVVDATNEEKVYSTRITVIVDGKTTGFQYSEYIYIDNVQYVTLREMSMDGMYSKATYAYDEFGRVIAESTEMTRGSMAQGMAYTYSYDEDGNQIVASTETKMLIGGKAMSWIKESYTYEGCSVTIVYEYKNSKGEVEDTYTKVIAHKNTTVTMGLAQGAESCEDGVVITETCVVCGHTETKTIYEHKYTEEVIYSLDGFELIKEGCACSNKIWARGDYSHEYFEYWDENGNWQQIEFYTLYNSGALIAVTQSVSEAGLCLYNYTSNYYIGYGIDWRDLIVYGGEWKEIIEIDLDSLELFLQVNNGSQTSHGSMFPSEPETTTTTDTNGNTVITDKYHTYCSICNKTQQYVEETKVYGANEALLSKVIKSKSAGASDWESINTYYYDADGNVTKEIYQSGTYISETTYRYYGDCGYVQITTSKNTEYPDETHTNVYVYSNHWESIPVYDYAYEGADSCGDGLITKYYCAHCGVHLYTDESVITEHVEYRKEVLWSNEGDYYSSICVFGCRCGEYERVQYDGYYNNFYDHENDREIITFYAYTEDGQHVELYTLTYVTEITTEACTEIITTKWYGGATQDSMALIYTTVERRTNHDLGSEQLSTETGTNNGRDTKTETYTTACKNCDYENVRVVYTEFEGGKEVLVRETRTEGGEQVFFDEVQYVYDYLGNRYESRKEYKENATWYVTETQYDFDKCTSTSITTYFNLDGSINNTTSFGGSCHVMGSYVYELRDGATSCEDGIVACIYCQRCGFKNIGYYSSGSHAHSYKNPVGEPRVIETECGTITIQKMECACHKFSSVTVNTDHGCDFSEIRNQYFEDGDYTVRTYRCMVTDCAYTYTVQTYHSELDETCHRYTYKTYRFGVSEEAQITDDGCDYVITVTDSFNTYHPTVYEDLNDGNGSYREVCSNCNMTIWEYRYNEDGKQVYQYCYDNGNYWSCEYEYDQYGNSLSEYYSYSSGSWRRITYFYEYINAPCEYNMYYIEEDSDKGYYESWPEYRNEHEFHYMWLTNSCTQYNCELRICRRCDHQEISEWGMPTMHYYEPIYDENNNIIGYQCEICGLENETGTNGYFILEDITNQHGVPAAGIYFPGLSEKGDWFVNLQAVVSNGETTRIENVDIPYDIYYVYSSGTIVVDYDAYHEYANELNNNGEHVEEFVFVFSILDQDSGTYLAHEIHATMCSCTEAN